MMLGLLGLLALVRFVRSLLGLVRCFSCLNRPAVMSAAIFSPHTPFNIYITNIEYHLRLKLFALKIKNGLIRTVSPTFIVSKKICDSTLVND